MLLVVLGLATTAGATTRAQTVERLASLPSDSADTGLRAWVNDGSGRTLRLGDEVEYHFESSRDGYLTVIHVDPHGVVTVLYPSLLPQGNQIVAGIEKTFPGNADGVTLQVEPPLGVEDVYAISTPMPLDREALGLSFAAGPVSIFEAAEAEPLVDRLEQALRERGWEGVAVAHVQQRSTGRRDDAEYTARDIVTYFTTRPRAIRRPKLDVHVRFATGSAELDDGAREALDEIGAALQDPQLEGVAFLVGGHTDDVGPEAYNLELSQRRAETVRLYLTEQHGVDANRLGVRAYGESAPLEPTESVEARAANRRVEFELER